MILNLKIIKTTLGLCAAFTLAGCAFKPVPRHVVGLDTYEIVQKIRCDVRDAVRGLALKLLENTGRYPELTLNLMDSETSEQAWRDFNIIDLKSPEKEVFLRYANVTVGYEFKFDMTEDDDQMVTANVLRDLPLHPFKFDLTGKAMHRRQNVRNFTIVDQFDRLGINLDNSICVPELKKHTNLAYPIANDLGTADFVEIFLSLNQYGNLFSDKSNPDIPKMTDTITFTTNYTGKADLGLDIKIPATDRFRLVKAGITFDKKRKDIHMLTMVLALPPKSTLGLSIAEQAQERKFALQRTQQAVAEELERQRLIGLDSETSLIRKSILETLN